MNRVWRIVALLSTLPLVGTIGFMILEGWNFFDALYMSVITLTTVGFREVHTLSSAGRVFVILFLVAGTGVFLYGVAQIGEIIVRAELKDIIGRANMDSAVKTIKDHFIVCGGGRMGNSVAQHLAAKGLPFVVVDREEQVIEECRGERWPWLLGDATDDRTLLDAGVERAYGLASALSGDADNLYVVLSARLLAPEIRIVARATDEKSAVKMKKAGANRVISMFHAGAMKMAQLLAKPDLEDFFEIFTTQGSELDLAEIHVGEDGPYAGKTLEQTDFRTSGVLIVGIRRASGELILPVSSTVQIQRDDQLIALGKSDDISKFIDT